MNKVTISDWLQWTVEKFKAAELCYGHGTDNAWDEAVQLVLQCAHLPVDSGDEVLECAVSPEVAARIEQCIEARITQGIPLPYLTQRAWFAGLEFYVDPRVLIPRSPFGEWIDRQFQPWVQPDQVKRILEVGTGSGCMAIACAHYFPNAYVDAVDIDREALMVADINVRQHHLEERVRLFQSDCFSAVDHHRYDIIISNPPYVSADEMPSLPREFKHEPQHALMAEHEGMAVVDQLLANAYRYLTPQGILVIEVGYSAEIFQAHYPDLPVIWLEQERGGEGLFLLTRDLLPNKA